MYFLLNLNDDKEWKSKHGKQFSVVSEVSIPTPTAAVTPDVLVFHKRPVNWLETKPALTEPPILAIEIQNPSQSTETTIEKAKHILETGVKSVWIIQPELQTVSVFSKSYPLKTFVEGTITDKACDIELPFDKIFAVE